MPCKLRMQTCQVACMQENIACLHGCIYHRPGTRTSARRRDHTKRCTAHATAQLTTNSHAVNADAVERRVRRAHMALPSGPPFL